MRVDHCFGNGEAETKAAEAASDRALPLLKGVKDFVDLFRLDPNATVRNSDFNFVGSGVERFDSYAAVLRGEFDPVLDQVPKNLL